MKTERLQVLIEPEQRERLEQTAASRGVSVGHLVRSALDLAYPPRDRTRADAADAILDFPAMELPDPTGLRAELDRLRGRE